jgi:hypothetical protein
MKLSGFHRLALVELLNLIVEKGIHSLSGE